MPLRFENGDRLGVAFHRRNVADPRILAINSGRFVSTRWHPGSVGSTEVASSSGSTFPTTVSPRPRGLRRLRRRRLWRWRFWRWRSSWRCRERLGAAGGILGGGAAGGPTPPSNPSARDRRVAGDRRRPRATARPRGRRRYPAELRRYRLLERQAPHRRHRPRAGVLQAARHAHRLAGRRHGRLEEDARRRRDGHRPYLPADHGLADAAANLHRRRFRPRLRQRPQPHRRGPEDPRPPEGRQRRDPRPGRADRHDRPEVERAGLLDLRPEGRRRGEPPDDRDLRRRRGRRAQSASP